MKHTKQIAIYIGLIISGLVCAQTAQAERYKYTCYNKLAKSTPNSRFEILSDGSEVKDKQTGLIWQRCSLGHVWDGKNCTGESSLVSDTWEGALKRAHDLGNGYRLPNIRELQSIVEKQCSVPSANQEIFPRTAPGIYWSSTPMAFNGTKNVKHGHGGAWGVAFSEGYTTLRVRNEKTERSYIRAVRSVK